MSKSDSDSRELKPRNIVWVEDDPPFFRCDDFQLLRISYYTHAIICFFHLTENLNLVYNNGRDPYRPDLKWWWEYLGSVSKTLMLSVGGWIENESDSDWKHAQGNEEAAAALIVAAAQKLDIAGIDFNFEGPYREDEGLLKTFAKMVVEVRKRWNGLFTITPMRDNLASQLKYIREALGSDRFSDCLSWINVQFYTYSGITPNPEEDVIADYENVLAGKDEWGNIPPAGSYPLPASMVAAGFPLSEYEVQFNQDELKAADRAVRLFTRSTRILREYLCGVFGALSQAITGNRSSR
jgi:hypothetical protein